MNTDATQPAPSPVTAPSPAPSPSRRRTVRRWIAWGTLPLTLLALLLVFKLVSMFAFAHQSISAYMSDNPAASVQAAEAQRFLNWFEPYKAPFNEGVGLAGGGDLAAAQGKFEEALTMARGLEVCDIRVNLALVLEWQGDAATTDRNPALASQFYSQALEVTVETPEECAEPEAQQQTSDPRRDLSESLEDLESRLQEKQRPEQDQPQEPQPQPDQSQLDELQQKLEEGAREREERQSGGDEEGPGGQAEKPW